MKSILLFIIAHFIGITVLVGQDSAIQTTGKPPKLSTITGNSKVDNKYSFEKIGTKTTSVTNVSKNYATQTALSSSVSYTLNEEARQFINWFKPKNESELISMKNWGAFYLSSMENILMSKGIPKQLVYLAVIETHLNVNLVSWAGAAGMWQFMPETAREYGLQVSGGVDERFDWHKSTYAAADYLRYLYNQFHDWLLVVAAYNGGPGRVNSAIRASGSRDFWTLQHNLRLESSNHVKKFIATQYIMEGNLSIGVIGTSTLTPTVVPPAKKPFNPLEKGAVAIDTSKGLILEQLTGRYNSLIIAKYILLDIQSFNLLNPNFDTELSKDESNYTLRLTNEKMALFKQYKTQIMSESLYLYLALSSAQTKETKLQKAATQVKKPKATKSKKK